MQQGCEAVPEIRERQGQTLTSIRQRLGLGRLIKATEHVIKEAVEDERAIEVEALGRNVPLLLKLAISAGVGPFQFQEQDNHD